LYAMLTMAECHDKTGPGNLPTIMERSLFSAYEVFVETQKKVEYLTEVEHGLLGDYYQRLKRALPKKRPELVIYLQASPPILKERTLQRGRKEERLLVNLEYLQELENSYEQYIANWERKGVPTVRICTEAEESKVLDEYSKCFRQIRGILQSDSLV